MQLSQTTAREWALLYASLGWSVVPLHPYVPGSADKGDSGKKPIGRRWNELASSDPVSVGMAFPERSDARVGVGLISPDGCGILDFDKHAEKPNPDVLLTYLGIDLTTFQYQRTGGGGLHLAFSGVGGPSAAPMWKGFIDRRFGASGQGAAAPTVTAKGTYSWPNGVPDARSLPLLPKCFHLSKAATDVLWRLVDATRDMRNDTLNVTAFKLGGLVRHKALLSGVVATPEELRSIAEAWLRGFVYGLSGWVGHDMDDREVEGTIRSGLDNGIENCRSRGSDAPVDADGAEALFQAVVSTPDGPDRDVAIARLSEGLAGAPMATRERFAKRLEVDGIAGKRFAKAIAAGKARERADEDPYKIETAHQLLELAKKNGVEFRAAFSGVPFAVDSVRGTDDGSRYPIQSDYIDVRLGQLALDVTGVEPQDSLVRRALKILHYRGHADIDSGDRLPMCDTTPRVQRTVGGGIAYDAGRKTIIVDRDGLREVPRGEFMFARSTSFEDAPVELAGTPEGDRAAIEEFYKLFPNLTRQDFVKAMVWIVGSLAPIDERLLLDMCSPARSGKSTLAICLNRVVDPTGSVEGTLPPDKRSATAAALNRWVMSVGNASTLGEFSDFFCQLSTGFNTEPRALYTDLATYSVTLRRPVIITSIAEIVEAGDVADRSLRIRMQQYEEDKGKPTADVLAAVDSLLPRIRGAVFRGLVEQMRCPVPKNDVFKSPMRFAEAWPWVRGALAYMGIGVEEVHSAVADSIKEGRLALVDNDVTLSKLCVMLNQQPTICVGQVITTGEMYARLEEFVGGDMAKSGLVRSPIALGKLLGRSLSALKAHGVVLENRKVPGGTRGWMRKTDGWGAVKGDE